MIDYYFIPVFLSVVVILFLLSYFLDDKFFAILGGMFLMVFGVYVVINGIDSLDPDADSEYLFSPQYVFSHTNATIPLAGSSVWTNITFDQEAVDIMSGIVHDGTDYTNDTFTVNEDGIYNVDYDFDVEDTSVGASDIDVAGRLILTNGSEVVGSVFETDITKQGTEIELSHNFLVSCRAGEQFKFQFVADDADVQISTHGTFGVHPESATVLMMKIANLGDS